MRDADQPKDAQRDASTREPDRPAFSNAFESLCALAAYSANLSCFWLFPQLLMQHGGVLVLLPYALTTLLIVWPLYHMQLARGQFSGLGMIRVWRSVPLFQGLGYAAALLTTVVSLYYALVASWALYYALQSVAIRLPWEECSLMTTASNWCRLEKPNCSSEFALLCRELNTTQINYTFGHTVMTSSYGFIDRPAQWKLPAEDYFHNEALALSAGIGSLGGITKQVFFSLLITLGLCNVVLARGAASAGKVTPALLLVKYVLGIVLLVRVATIAGASNGIAMYLTPRPAALITASFWGGGALLAFLTATPSWGSLLTLSSLSSYHSKLQYKAWLLPLFTAISSLSFGLIPAGLAGILAEHVNEDLSHLIIRGPSMVFVVAAQGLQFIRWKPVYSLLFFVLVFLTAFLTLIWMLESVVSSVMDAWPRRWRRWYARIGSVKLLTGILLLLGLFASSHAGMYMLTILDLHTKWNILLLAFIELNAVYFCYGVDRILEDIQGMTASSPIRSFWKTLYALANFILLIILYYFIELISGNKHSYGAYEYPLPACLFGWLVSLIPLLCVSIGKLVTLAQTPGHGFRQVLETSMRPTKKWGPSQHAPCSKPTEPEKQAPAVQPVQQNLYHQPKYGPRIADIESASKAGKVLSRLVGAFALRRLMQVTSASLPKRDAETQTGHSPAVSPQESRAAGRTSRKTASRHHHHKHRHHRKHDKTKQPEGLPPIAGAARGRASDDDRSLPGIEDPHGSQPRRLHLPPLDDDGKARRDTPASSNASSPSDKQTAHKRRASPPRRRARSRDSLSSN